jgi:hypothetical protein
MTLNFPSNPTNGQTYQGYTYSSSNGYWDAPGTTVDLSSIAEDILPDADSSRSLGSTANKWKNLHASNITSGDHLPLTDSSYNLGSPTKKWKALHLSSNTLFLGDSGSISSGPGGAISMPLLKIGSGAGAVELTASADGKLETKGTTAAGVTESAAKASGAAKTVTDMSGLIALTGMATGETCLVTSLNRIFMYTGTGWFKIADMVNESPTAITGVDAAIALAIDGTASVVTAVSTDPEGFPLTWSYAVTTGSLGSTATVSQTDNVFTITPSSTEADAGTFGITFSVTDGATGAVSATSAFTLAFYTFNKPTLNTEYTFGVQGAPSIYAQTADDIEFTMPSAGGSYQGPRTTVGSLILPITGKVYFEMVCSWSNYENTMWTFSKYDWSTQPNSAQSAAAYGWIYSSNSLYNATNNVPPNWNTFTDFATGSSSSPSTAERIGVAIDHTNNQWWFRKANATWIWGDPTTSGSGYNSSTAGTAHDHIHFYISSGSGTTMSPKRVKFFGKNDNLYAVPTGYSSL